MGERRTFQASFTLVSQVGKLYQDSSALNPDIDLILLLLARSAGGHVYRKCLYLPHSPADAPAQNGQNLQHKQLNIIHRINYKH